MPDLAATGTVLAASDVARCHVRPSEVVGAYRGRMAITPDAKDWTWVLRSRCPDCGFDAGAAELADVGRIARESVSVWQRVLARDDVRERPDETTWSPLEYACHVRDVHGVFADRLALCRIEDGPEFPDWDQDAAAVDGRYGSEDPQRVAGELSAAAERTARAFDEVSAEEASRPGLRGDGFRFSILTLGRYYAHDLVHHAWDVTGERSR